MANLKTAADNNYISRNATNFLKGIALIMMFIHHFFTFPQWFVSGVSYDHIYLFAKYLNEPFKLCVAIFAFLTGYFYFYHKKKDMKYSIKKASDVWILYVFVFLIFSLFSVALGTFDTSSENFFMELFGLRNITMIFCWYVIFYIMSMLILPFFVKLANRSSMTAFFFSVIIPSFLGFILSKLFPSASWLLLVISFLGWFKVIASGYLFAKHDLFSVLKRELHSENKHTRVVIPIILILSSFLFRFLDQSLDFIIVPFFIYGILELFYMVKNQKIFTVVNIIGKYSLPMWFTHCIFFNQCKEYTQPILYAPHQPILVFIWGVIICLSFAYLIKYPTAFILKQKDKLLRLK